MIKEKRSEEVTSEGEVGRVDMKMAGKKNLKAMKMMVQELVNNVRYRPCRMDARWSWKLRGSVEACEEHAPGCDQREDMGRNATDVDCNIEPETYSVEQREQDLEKKSIWARTISV